MCQAEHISLSCAEYMPTKTKPVMLGLITSINVWIDVGPVETPSALTMKPSSQFYNSGRWLSGLSGKTPLPNMMTDMTPLPGDFRDVMARQTGLDIEEYETNYTLQVKVKFTKLPTPAQLNAARAKLVAFVDRHFEPYD
jgi:hypothetical protein